MVSGRTPPTNLVEMVELLWDHISFGILYRIYLLAVYSRLMEEMPDSGERVLLKKQSTFK
jgi:hypothetical protein